MRNLGNVVAILGLILALPFAVWLDMRQLSESSLLQQAQTSMQNSLAKRLCMLSQVVAALTR